jgi:hypothetical protein
MYVHNTIYLEKVWGTQENVTILVVMSCRTFIFSFFICLKYKILKY